MFSHCCYLPLSSFTARQCFHGSQFKLAALSIALLFDGCMYHAMRIEPLCSWLFDKGFQVAIGMFFFFVAVMLRIAILKGGGEDGDHHLTRPERAVVQNLAALWEDDHQHDRYQ